MRIVAIGTRDLARRNRMGRKVMDLRSLRQVATKADIALRFLRQYFILRLVNLVAGNASYIVARMHAALPMQTLAGSVAIEAGATANFR